MNPSTSAPSLSAAARAPGATEGDFAGWLPPMLVKELRQGLRTRGFVGTLIAFQLVMLVLTLIALNELNDDNYGSRMQATGILNGFFWSVLIVLLLLSTPMRALSGLQLEVDMRTIDLLMLTRLNAWRVVLGKWLSLIAQATLLLVAMLPYLVIRYFTANADLVRDVGLCLVLLTASAGMTAGALWASGVPKQVRVLIVIGLVVFCGQVFAGMLGPMFRGGFGGAPVTSMLSFPLDLVNAALFTGYFLVSAVRNIAPPAENHCGFTRVLPLVAVVLAVATHVFGTAGHAVRQLYMSAGFLAVVAMIELGGVHRPMTSHWRPWLGRGALGRFAGRFVLPGWPSALRFTVAGIALWMMAAWIILPAGTNEGQARHVLWMAVLAFSGLVFPVLLHPVLARTPVPPRAVYITGVAVPIVLCGLAVWLAEGPWRIKEARTVMEVVPTAGFLVSVDRPLDGRVLWPLQGIVALAIFISAMWLGRAYWRRVRGLGGDNAAETKP